MEKCQTQTWISFSFLSNCQEPWWKSNLYFIVLSIRGCSLKNQTLSFYFFTERVIDRVDLAAKNKVGLSDIFHGQFYNLLTEIFILPAKDKKKHMKPRIIDGPFQLFSQIVLWNVSSSPKTFHFSSTRSESVTPATWNQLSPWNMCWFLSWQTLWLKLNVV